MKLSTKVTTRLKRNYSDWVLVTGATSGIGEELARKFGEAGFNLVITGRRENLLTALATELFDAFKVEVVPVPGDLSQPAEVLRLIQATEHLSIGIAVMNAGFGTSGELIAADLEQEVNMLNLNCKALFMLTHHFAKQMSQAQRGAIVLMSSMVGFQGVPNAAHYAATKAYVQSLGEGIARELKPKGVDVLCAAPGPVASGFAKRARMEMGKALRPEDVGVPIIKAIGRKTTVLPGFLTKFLVYNLRLLPRWAKVRIMGKVMAGFTKQQRKATATST